VDLKFAGPEWEGQLNGGFGADDRGFGCRLERDFPGTQKLEPVFAEERSGDSTFNAGIRANDPGIVQVGSIANAETSSNINRPRAIGGKIQVCQFDAGIARGTKRGAGVLRHFMVRTTLVTMHGTNRALRFGAENGMPLTDFEVTAASATIRGDGAA
jgi:hypothetical protein